MQEKTKTILLTGAGKGIGLAVVQHFITHSLHRVIAVSRNISELENWKNNLPSEKQAQLHLFSIDITNDFSTFIHQLKTQFPSIDILINNAGLLINKPFQEVNENELLAVFQTNVFAPFRLIQQCITMMPIKSHILNIGSMGGFQGSSKFPGLSAYSSSKGALAVLTECLAEELKPREIAVNCLALGSVQTEMLATAFPNFKSPTNTLEMAEFICHFALNGNRWFNGKNIPVSISVP